MNLLLHLILGNRPLAQGLTADVPGSIFHEYLNNPTPQDNSYVICLVDIDTFPF